MAKKTVPYPELDPKNPDLVNIMTPAGKVLYRVTVHTNGNLSIQFANQGDWHPQKNQIFGSDFRISPLATNYITLHPVSILVT